MLHHVKRGEIFHPLWGAPLEALRWNPPPILAHMVGGGYH